MKNITINIIKILVIGIICINFNINSLIFANSIEVKTNEVNIEDSKEQALESQKVSLDFDKYISIIQENIEKAGIEDVEINNIANELIENKGVNINGIIEKLLNLFFSEFMIALKGAIIIYIIAIFMAIMSHLELEKKSDITKISNLACFITIATIMIKIFLEIINNFKGIVTILTTLMQIISPFLMAVLIATGSITSTGIIQPLLLFLASFVSFVVNYLVIPFFCISVAINVICRISDNVKLDKISKIFPTTAIWVMGILLTLFLGVLSLETKLTASVDSLSVKTVQATVSNFVPVVGKFFSDSFEVVVGSTKIIGNMLGTVGIISIILVSVVPILKIFAVMCIYYLLAALIEPILPDNDILKFISSFADLYKTLLGIFIGIIILFVISTGIILNLVNAIVV